VHDFFESTDEFGIIPACSLFLMLHPDCEIVSHAAGTVVVRQSEVELTLESSAGKWEFLEAFVSPSYGVKHATTRLTLCRDPGVAENTLRLSW
jgi:hypothetical protein